MKKQIIFIMGVSGSGKTTIGKLLAKELDFPFFDADDFHPKENVEKMSQGKALNDEDRKPWLDNLNVLAKEKEQTTGAIITCSALKEKYRVQLKADLKKKSILIFLHGTKETLLERMGDREGHFMPSSLLQSQLDTLEKPTNAQEISIEKNPAEIVQEILALL